MASKRYCLVISCHANDHMFSFPKDLPTRAKWIKFLTLHQPNVKVKPSSRLCFRHFAKKDISNYYACQMRISSRMNLIPGSAPRYFDASEEDYDSPVDSSPETVEMSAERIPSSPDEAREMQSERSQTPPLKPPPSELPLTLVELSPEREFTVTQSIRISRVTTQPGDLHVQRSSPSFDANQMTPSKTMSKTESVKKEGKPQYVKTLSTSSQTDYYFSGIRNLKEEEVYQSHLATEAKLKAASFQISLPATVPSAVQPRRVRLKPQD